MPTHHPEEIPGRCISCGFLAKLDTESRSKAILHETIWGDRRKGLFFKHDTTDTVPYCYRLVPEFFADLTRPREGNVDPARVIEVINKDRSCPKWTRYEINRSPKEHLEKVETLELEQRRQAFELKMEQERRDFEVAMVERGERTERRHRTVMFRVGVVGVVLIMIEILAVVFGAGPGSILGDWLSR